MRIALFKPPDFLKAPLDINKLNGFMGKDFSYASMGRNCLFHILKSFGASGRILLPAYICDTVLEPVRKLGIEPCFYDLDKSDLNPSVDSIAALQEKTGAKFLLAASMYGNPADMTKIENYCKERNVILIDDAAQSFGAEVDGRKIGTFGDAGFFSFSPGKPLAGHMGGFFRTSVEGYHYKPARHCIYHMLNWLDFSFNRLHAYGSGRIPLFRAFTFARKALSKLIRIENDGLCPFEENIIGGLLSSFRQGLFAFRAEYFRSFSDNFKTSQQFRIIQSIRGNPNPHKIPLLFENENTAAKMLACLRTKGISASGGYSPLADDKALLPNTASVKGRVVELPIENNKDRMQYLFEIVGEFVKCR